MPRAALPDGIELEYDTFGDPAGIPLLLVRGLGAQMVRWEEGFCRHFVDAGRYVIRFDNRDVGLSTKLDGVEVDVDAVVAAALGGGDVPPVPYLLSDLAADAIGLLDHLGIARAHVAGESMGGMIVQTLAIEHPHRLLSATSIMSTVGDPAYGAPAEEAIEVLMRPTPPTRDAVIAASSAYAVWNSRRYFSPEKAAAVAAADYDRSHYPAGWSRQFAAVIASGDRTEALRGVTVPTLVIHGLDDRLVTPSGGRRTAELIPGAHLMEVSDMGHDLPEELWPLLTGAMIGHQDVAMRTSALEPAS